MQLSRAGKCWSFGTFNSLEQAALVHKYVREKWEKADLVHKFVREKFKSKPVMRPFDAEAKKQVEGTSPSPGQNPNPIHPVAISLQGDAEAKKQVEGTSPSAEQHHDPPHPVAISVQGDVVNPEHVPMPGIDLPSHYPDHSPLPTNHLSPSQPPVNGKKRISEKLTGSMSTTEKTPASKKKKKSEIPAVVIPPRTTRQERTAAIKNSRDAALAVAHNREIMWHPNGKWVSCIDVCFSFV